MQMQLPQSMQTQSKMQRKTQKQPIKQSIKQPIKQSMKQPIKQSIKQPIKQSMKQPMKQPIKQPIKQPMKQSIKQLQSTTHKSKVRIILDPEDHYLSEFGYYDVSSKTVEERIAALHKLINHFLPIKGKMGTYNYIIHALNARYILNRNTNRKTASIFKNDQRIISKEYLLVKNKK
jgi:hypothetical protein